MIASPSDVSDERDIVRSVIYEWNDVNASVSKIVLSPVGWESHTSPELGARPQELINSRLLIHCDLLIGVFWTRLGTPTGMAKSGSVEEIEKHFAAGKPAMIYFSSRAMPPQSIDVDQYAALKFFQERLKPSGLIESFDSTTQFKEKFSRQLQHCLNSNPYLLSLMNEQSSATDLALIEVNRPRQELLLSDQAKTLLKAAVENQDGIILKVACIGGKLIQAGGQQFGGDGAREFSKWEKALNELFESDLVVARGFEDQFFELTHPGWLVADKL